MVWVTVAATVFLFIYLTAVPICAPNGFRFPPAKGDSDVDSANLDCWSNGPIVHSSGLLHGQSHGPWLSSASGAAMGRSPARYRTPGLKQYSVSMLLFSTVGFVVGFAILALQPWFPLNPDNKGMLSPSTIFHTVTSFLAQTAVATLLG